MNEAARISGQQRPHLLRVAGVVQHDEQPPAGDQRPVERGRLVHPHRGLLGRHTQGGEKSGQRVDRPDRQAVRIAAQVDEQLPVGKPVAHPVRPLQCQRRLADPGHTRERQDHYRALARQEVVQPGQLRPAPGERGRRGGQLGRGPMEWSRVLGWRLVNQGLREGQPAQLRILSEDGRFEGTEIRAGVDAELVAQRGTQPLVRRQRLHLPAGAVQREDQVTVQFLVEGMTTHELLQLRQHLDVFAHGEPRPHQTPHGPQP